jgi:hypothetical protein
MEQSPSWEANSPSADQEIFVALWKKMPPLVRILNQMNPVHPFISCFFKMHFNIIRQATRGPSKLSFLFKFFD